MARMQLAASPRRAVAAPYSSSAGAAAGGVAQPALPLPACARWTSRIASSRWDCGVELICSGRRLVYPGSLM